MRFWKLPVEVEAVRLDWSTWPQVAELVEAELASGTVEGGVEVRDGVFYWGETAEQHIGDGSRIALLIETNEASKGPMIASQGDWIIRGAAGELYPCPPDVFEKTYEAVV